MFQIDSNQRITKELLLSKNSQETYFEHYLGVPVKKGLFVSPRVIRIDHKPTCSFYKNPSGTLFFNDFAGPKFNFIGCVMHIFNCSYWKALRIIANDFGIISLKDVPVNTRKTEYSGVILKETTSANIQVEIKEFSEKELKWWGSFGISLKTLNKFKVYSIKSIFLNGYYFSSSSESSPVFGYYGGKNTENNELWRLYMPNKRNYRFLSNWSSTMIQGSKQLKKSNDFIVITKSLKDVMCLYEFGITAIAPNSENLFLTDSQYIKVKNKFKNIYLFYDTDLPGIKSMNKIRKKFKDIKILFIPKKFKCKDFSDFVKKYGTLKTLDFVDKYKKILLNG